jgi:hypothetical protein
MRSGQAERTVERENFEVDFNLKHGRQTGARVCGKLAHMMPPSAENRAEIPC